jgi:hypothetical protein
LWALNRATQRRVRSTQDNRLKLSAAYEPKTIVRNPVRELKVGQIFMRQVLLFGKVHQRRVACLGRAVVLDTLDLLQGFINGNLVAQ